MYKRLLLTFSLILGGIGIAGFFMWQQAMQLPSWYTQTSSKEKVISVNKIKSPQPEEVLRKVSDNLTAKTTGEVQLDAAEVNSLIIYSIGKKDDNRKFSSAIKSTNTQIKNGKISVGAVVEASAISPQELSAWKETKIIQLIQRLPGKEKRLYIGIEGKPSIRDTRSVASGERKFTFDDTTRISLGNFSFPIAEVSQNLGISQESFNQFLSQELKKLPIKLESINVEGERVIIRGSGNKI